MSLVLYSAGGTMGIPMLFAWVQDEAAQRIRDMADDGVWLRIPAGAAEWW
jgi:hypothetical protein